MLGCVPLVVLVLGLAAPLCGQQTHLVPSQFPSVQDAVNAAAPGDIVEIDSNSGQIPITNAGVGDLVIDKPLTIAGRPGRATLSFSEGWLGGMSVSGHGGSLVLAGPTPMDVTLDSLDLIFHPDQDGAVQYSRFGVVGVAKDFCIVDCALSVPQSCHTVGGFRATIDVEAQRLLIRGSTVSGYTAQADYPCHDNVCYNRGTSAIYFTGELLFIECCDIAAGDASYMQWSSNCNPPYGITSGCAAVVSSATRAILRGVTLRNGNATRLAPGPWHASVIPILASATAGTSTLGGEEHLWGVREILGWSGGIGVPPANPAGTLLRGGVENLVLSSDVHVGGTLDLEVNNTLWPSSGIGLWAISSGLQPAPTLVGRPLVDVSELLALDAVLFLPPSAPATLGRSLAIPNNPSLVGFFLVGQVAVLGSAGGDWFGNVSFAVVRP